MRKTLATIFVLSVFSLIIFFFVIEPTIKDIKAFNDRIQIERVSLENKYTSRRNVKNIIADLKYVTDSIAPLDEKMVIKKGQEVEFISALEKIAETNKLVQKIKISPSVTNGGTKLAEKQDLAITLSGNYIDALKYINELEKSDLYIIINSINITSGGSETNGAKSAGEIKAYLEGYVYFSI